MSDRLSEPRYAGKHSPSLLSPESPGGSPKLQVPSPIVTRRTRTESTWVFYISTLVYIVYCWKFSDCSKI